jgi:hypothetical protein
MYGLQFTLILAKLQSNGGTQWRRTNWQIVPIFIHRHTHHKWDVISMTTFICKYITTRSVPWPFKACWLRDAPTSLTFSNCTLCPHCMYVFCIYPRTNSDLCHLQHKLIGFYNRDEKCLNKAVCASSLKGSSATANHGLEILPTKQSVKRISVFCICQVAEEAQILEVFYRER